MEKREITCIGCPMGCTVTVELDGDEIVSVTGYTCPRGNDYARKEVTNPTRIVTSSVPVEGGDMAMVSVKTKNDIPKGKIFEAMDEIRKTKVTAPIHIGDVVIHDCAGTGVDIVATRNVEKAAV